MKLYVGNLNFKTTEDTLMAIFGAHGEVQEVAIVSDRETGRPRGFAFVTMDDEGATRAVEALNGSDLDGRNITVNEARPKESRGGAGGGGFRGGSGGGGGRGGFGGGGGGGRRDRY